MEEINDVTILKEKILKIDSIFTLIAEKQVRIKTLETKTKKQVREINTLRNKSNELLTKVEKSQKLQEQTVLESGKKYAALKKKYKENTKKMRAKFMQFKKRTTKRHSQIIKHAEEKHAQHIRLLKKTIRILREKLNFQVLNQIPPKNGTNKSKEVKVLQNIIIKPKQVENMEMETQTEEDTEIEGYCIDAMLMDMMNVPDLMTPFRELPRAIRSVQTQTTPSTVTRPIQTCQQTSEIALQCNLSKNDHVKALCAFIQSEKENAQKNNMRSFSIQTEIIESSESKSTQTCSTMVTTASQTTEFSLKQTIFKEKKITLKNAVTALKKSKQSFTISNGVLMHYSKQPISRVTNEVLVARSVFRRLAKYIDTQYGSLDGKKRRRMSNILCETKQLERSRELMKLYRSSFMFSPNSDTESSGYESRVQSRHHLSSLNFESTTPTCDSGIISEIDQITEDGNEQDVSSLLDEVLVDLPILISPFDENEAEKLSEVYPVAPIEKEIVVETVQARKRKLPVKNRLLSIRNKIKKCNQVNVTRIAKDEEIICPPVKQRRALVSAQIPKQPEINVENFSNVCKVENTTGFDKVSIEKEYQKMKTKCMFNMTNSNTQNILNPASLLQDRKLKAEDILALLNPKKDKEDVVLTNEMKIDTLTGNRNINTVKETNSPVIDPISMTTRSGRTLLRPVRKLAQHGQGVSNIIQTSDQITQNGDNHSQTSINKVNTLEKKQFCLENNLQINESLMTTRSGKAFGRTALSTPPKDNTPLLVQSVETLPKCEQGIKRKRGRPPKIRQFENTNHQGLPDLKIKKAGICSLPEIESRIEIDLQAQVKAEYETKEAVIKINETNVDLNGETQNATSNLRRKENNVENCHIKESNKTQMKTDSESETKELVNKMNEPKVDVIIETQNDTSNLKGNETLLENDTLKNDVQIILEISKKLKKFQKIDSPSTSHKEESKSIKMDINADENCAKYLSDESDSDSGDKTHTISQNPIVQKQFPEDISAYQQTKVKFKMFKKALDKCVWARGDARICQEEIELIKSIDLKILVNLIIQCLTTDRSPIEKPTGDTSMEPLLTTKQKVVMGLLIRFETELPNIGYLLEIIACIERYLLFTKKQEMEALEDLSRFYTALCRLKQDKQKVRAFLSDLLYIAPAHKFTIIYTVITSWLNVLQLYNGDFSGAGVDRVLANIVMTTPIMPSSDNQQDNCIGVMRNLFVTYYKYPNEAQCVDDLIMSLLESYMCESVVQFEAAILILCAYNAPKWTYEKIQLIGELCKVSVDAQVVRNLLRLITNIAKKLEPSFRARVYVYISELFLYLKASKVGMDLSEEEQLRLNS